jgi:HAD superfamily hydrolase (TIGR01509 family)
MTMIDAPSNQALGLPPEIRACLFDLDGVLTQTAVAHIDAWKETFDEFLRDRAALSGTPFVPFERERDYRTYVDGRARADGVRSFLASRGIELPEGEPDDAPTLDSVHGLGNRKNERLLARLEREGVGAYAGSVEYVRAARRRGLRTAVVSASANCREVLAAAGIADLFEARIDGLVSERCGLRGKPAADTYLAAARVLEIAPSEAAVFDDALAGVAAGRAGRFRFVVGVNRSDQADTLRKEGADVVVSDLRDLLETR